MSFYLNIVYLCLPLYKTTLCIIESKEKAFENIAGIEEITYNKQFLLFLTMLFYLCLLSTNTFNFGHLNFAVWQMR